VGDLSLVLAIRNARTLPVNNLFASMRYTLTIVDGFGVWAIAPSGPNIRVNRDVPVVLRFTGHCGGVV
ncbi:MAG: hypothetical protein ACKVKG_11160, partial [Alphaproteobacteria bacterium]|jgi:hypothetical protein